jgi:hypothetical protein
LGTGSGRAAVALCPIDVAIRRGCRASATDCRGLRHRLAPLRDPHRVQVPPLCSASFSRSTPLGVRLSSKRTQRTPDLPTEQLVGTWANRAPPDFVFDIKAFRTFIIAPASHCSTQTRTQQLAAHTQEGRRDEDHRNAREQTVDQGEFHIAQVRSAPLFSYTPTGYVSGSSARSHFAVRSNGSTARVWSKWITASNCSGRRA